jgi:hypothetical protein
VQEAPEEQALPAAVAAEPSLLKKRKIRLK